MMKYEFEQIAGYEVSDSDYTNVIEPMYMSTNLNKAEFAKCIDRKRFEIKKEKSPETIAIEKECKEKIAEYKKEIEYYKDNIKRYELFYSMDGDRTWKEYIKSTKEVIKRYQIEINNYKFVLGA